MRKNLRQKENRVWPDFLLGMGLGLLVFWAVYGFSTLNPTYDSWIYAGYIEGDIMQHYAGWLYFRHSPWTWPLTVAQNLAIPYGTSVVYTDSIPPLAILFKILSPILPATFQYMGLYNLANFMLQGGFAFVLLRHFKFSRPFCAAGTLVFAAMPVMVERAFRHTGLASHWLILAAVWQYFKARRCTQQGEKFPLLGFALLCVFSAPVHAYITPMVYALFAAALLERIFSEKKLWRYAAYLAGCMAGTLVVMYFFGFFSTISAGWANAFGEYSMNLNAAFNPRSIGFGAEDNVIRWSRLLPVLPQARRQFEGFNYLGLGVLLALCTAVVYTLARLVAGGVKKDNAFFKKCAGFLQGHIWLLAVCGCLAVFAVGNFVWWGDTLLFEIPVDRRVLYLATTFRASGRMFWLCGYLLALGAIVWCGRALRGRCKTLAVCLLALVQLWDISPALMQKRAYFANGPIVVENEYTSEGWIFLMENYDTVFCLGNVASYPLSLELIRYNPNRQTNIQVANRGIFPDIDRSYYEMMQYLRSGAPLEDGVLYLCTDKETFDHVREGLHPAARGYNTGHMYLIGNPLPGCPLAAYLPLPAETG